MNPDITLRDNRGRFTRRPQTFAERVEPQVWADLEAQIAAMNAGPAGDFQTRALLLTAAFDTAAERLEWLGATA